MRQTIEQASVRPSLSRKTPGLVQRRTQASAVPPRLLVVDDSADRRDLLAQLLELHGFDACMASSLEVALVAARRFRPAAVLLDIHGLPGEAMGAAHMLRDQGGLQDAFIVAVTTFAGAWDLGTAREAGFDAVLAKPLLLEELLAHLRGAGIAAPQPEMPRPAATRS